MMKRIVVLGAGPAGLTCAWFLSKQGIAVDVVEIKPYVGGISRCFKYKEYWLDYGPHAFHIRNDELTQIVAKLSQSSPIKLAMKARLLFAGRYLDYPVDIKGIAKNLDIAFSIKVCFDFLIARLGRLLHNSNEELSFKEWGINRYGNTLYKMAFGDYSEKVWGLPAEAISCKLAQQKLPDLNLLTFLKDVFKGSDSSQKVHCSNYFYPENGIGKIFDRMCEEIRENGHRVILSSSTKRIEIRKDFACNIILSDGNSKDIKIECDTIISTIPIKTFIHLISDVPSEVSISASRLKYRGLILVYLIIDKDLVSDAMMVYLLDPIFKFNRFSEQKNISKRMIPEGKTVLCFEICCNEQDELWNSTDSQIYRLLLEDVKKIPQIPLHKIESFFVERLENTYPVFDLEFDRNLRDCFTYTAGLKNIILTGRQGLFLNNDMHDSMEMGLMAAKYVSNGKNDSLGWFKTMKTYLRNKLELF